jgi:hypothetical protein
MVGPRCGGAGLGLGAPPDVGAASTCPAWSRRRRRAGRRGPGALRCSCEAGRSVGRRGHRGMGARRGGSLRRGASGRGVGRSRRSGASDAGRVAPSPGRRGTARGAFGPWLAPRWSGEPRCQRASPDPRRGCSGDGRVRRGSVPRARARRSARAGRAHRGRVRGLRPHPCPGGVGLQRRVRPGACRTGPPADAVRRSARGHARCRGLLRGGDPPRPVGAACCDDGRTRGVRRHLRLGSPEPHGARRRGVRTAAGGSVSRTVPRLPAVGRRVARHHLAGAAPGDTHPGPTVAG